MGSKAGSQSGFLEGSRQENNNNYDYKIKNFNQETEQLIFCHQPKK